MEETPREECIHVYCIHLLRYKAYNKLTGDSSTIFETCISSGSRHSSELFHLPLLIFFCLVLMVLLHASAVEFMIFPLQLLDVAESELPKVANVLESNSVPFTFVTKLLLQVVLVIARARIILSLATSKV